MRFLLLLMVCVSFAVNTRAQLNTYLVTFNNKEHNSFSLSEPQHYLSQRALERRTRYGIAIDSLDLPVSPAYIDSIRLSGDVEILGASKWLNQVAITTTDAAALIKINSFPFINTVDVIAPRYNSNEQTNNKFSAFIATGPELPRHTSVESDPLNYGNSNGQIKIHRGDFLHRWGFTGRGLQIAMMDAGYLRYQTLQSFDSLRLDNRIIETWDFVERNEQVNEDYFHGMQCLSAIAANLPGEFVGSAPHASFYLYRTENVATEFPIEEHYLAMGFERADSAGADVTSTSLGYNIFSDPQFNHTYQDMNGKTTMGARSLNIGAKKGMMMVAAAGNEGNNTWHYITTPGDADSALTVGAVDTTGVPGGFSSYGPSSDGSIKPTLASVGWNAVVSNTSNGKPIFSSGTSFACPNLAGIATCLWQAFPEFNQRAILNSMIASASNTQTPDDRVGYGIPDVRDAFTRLQKAGYTQSVLEQTCIMTLQLNIKIMDGMKIRVERKTADDNTFTPLEDIQGTGGFTYQHFSLVDDLTNFSEGQITYRMSMIIGNDTTYILDSLSVQHTDNCHPVIPEKDEVIVSPNPANQQVKIMLQSAAGGRYEYELYNMLGQKVFKSSATVSIGRTPIFLSVAKYSSGIYFIKITDNKRKVTAVVPLYIWH